MRKQLLIASLLMLFVFPAFAAAGPLLVPDYDRDGVIDNFDFNRVAAGEQFTVWLNDDDDAAGTDEGVKAGDTNNDLHDVPSGEGNGRDCEDGVVNGRCDLLDFFPALVDVNGVDNYQNLTWKLCGAGVNVVFTKLKADYAGEFHAKEVNAFDGMTHLYCAAVTNLTEQGVVLPEGFLQNGWGVFVFECAATNDVEVMLCGYDSDGGCVCSNRLNLVVRNVEEMYGWMNLRPEAEKAVTTPRSEGAAGTVLYGARPAPRADDNRHFILVHGYNTNHEEARGNAAEFYKKLWQSGFDGMFTAVEWRGDQSQVNLFGVTFTPNYYVNVENAFAAAKPFADACAKLPGEKILVGHSLGNMLISSAIKDYGLDYTKFVMLNAAVAREAFDASAYDEAMVPEAWRDLGVGVGVGGGGGDLTNHLDRAARWYRNFADKKYDPYEYRRKLAWRGRFANLPRTVNYYSQSDNVLVNPGPNEPDPDAMLDRDDPRLENEVGSLLVAKLVNGRELNDGGRTGFGFWAFSEKIKGTWLLDTINDVLTNGLFEVSQADAYRREGGWGENEAYDPAETFDPANTRFTPFLDERMTEAGMLDILPAETERLRPQHLADAIPAESFAAGANPVATLENVDMEGFIGENEDWPLYEGGEGEAPRTNVWNHSTFREVAFYHTSKLYASLAAVGKPRVIIDTDLGSSVDDLFAIDFAARMHREGKLDLMAVMMNRPDESNPNDDPHGRGEFLKFADRYLAALGLGDLPLGKSLPLAEKRLPQHVFSPYWTLIYSNNVTGVGSLMPTNRTDAQLAALTNAVTLYRRLLNDAPDHSVVICSIGFLQNLKKLMESGVNYEGDAIGLTGLELIAAKVKELRIMGGRFDETSVPPDGTDGAEYNLAGDPVAAKMVLEGWPSPVVVSTWEVGLELEYKPDDALADFPPGSFDPVLRAFYTCWPKPLGEGDMNRLWDVMTVMPLTEGETLAPLSEKGGISVDEKGVTTFLPDPSSNRCYQVASNMNATAVMNRLREICRTGNPSVSMRVSDQPEPGVDYNGSELVFKFENIQCGSYAEDDLKFEFTVDGEKGEQVFQPDGTEWNDKLGVLSVCFVIPPDAVTAGNVYTGKLEVAMANDALGTNLLVTASRRLVQGEMVVDSEKEDWLYAYLSETPTNCVPETEMPDGVAVKVTTNVDFTGEPFEEQYLSATGAVQAAVRIVGDEAGGYKFQFYAFAVDEEENLHKGWWDCNVSDVVPVTGKNYEITAELMYPVDAQRQLYTVAFSAKDSSYNQPARPVFLGNMIDDDGGVGNAGRLGSISFAEQGEGIELSGNLLNKVNANLAKIDDYDEEYARVADAVAAAEGSPIRLLHAASWKPTEEDIGKPVSFLNKSWLVLDLSELPANARAVWSDVDGNKGTLTLELFSADTVVYGTIRTAEATDYVEGAIAIKDGKYVYVGDKAGVAAFVEEGVTKVIDHRGKGMVMPGCTDGHSHYTMAYGLAYMKGGVRFAYTDDKETVLQKLRAAAQEAKDAGKQSLFGIGWNYYTFRMGTGLTLEELDEATLGVSAVLFDSNGHSAYCNTECLKRCKIISEDGGTVLIKKIDGGLLELDKDGYPTGFVQERVSGYLTRMGGLLPDEIVDDEVAKAVMRSSQELLLSTGYTMALEGWSNQLHPSKFYEAAYGMDTNGELKVVFPMTYEVEPWQTNMTEQIDHLAWLNDTYGTRHVLPSYLKVFMDGCVETMTGAMIEPYIDETNTVYKSFWPVERLAEITAACNAKGLTVHTHTMGDAAVKEVTDAYIQGGDGTHRNCLVHLRNVRPEDFRRLAENDIACTAGMTWHVVNGGGSDEHMAAFLDEKFIKHAYPIKSFFDAGVKVSSHTDFPANGGCPQDPFGIIEVAVTGLVPNPPDGMKPFDTDELITVEQAFQALTINGAWQLGLENERGSIAVGKWADFVLADQDVFACAADDIGKTKVVSTWFEGEKVYQTPSERVIEIFEEICAVPRSSANEDKIGDWLMQWAEDHGFAATRDTAGCGNVFIDVPATPGMEARALVILQAHQDMVAAVKEGVTHDWTEDPVVPVIDGGWMHSKDNETSLGADDGIGIATALAIAEGGMAHGPLRLVFTVEEETTQVGVKGVDPKMVADAKYLINIDSETEGEVTISSAINDNNRFTSTPTAVAATKSVALAVKASGFFGGHSGLDINLGRHNAIIELASMLTNLADTVGLELVSFTGGSAENAIPTSATAVILVADTAASNTVASAAAALQSTIATGDDANAKIEVSAADLSAQVLDSASRDKLLELITTIPNGVIKMSEDVPGLVQTSANLGVVDATDAGMRVSSSVRSSSNEDYDAVLAGNEQLASRYGFSWTHVKNCEAWPADPNSRLLAICTNAYRNAFGTDMSVIAVHAGLECGTFKLKNPDLDMISLGATVVSPHTFNERCEVASCAKIWTLMEGILAAIPEGLSVTPGVPVVFDTAEAATNGTKIAVLTPSESVAAVLTEAEKRRLYGDSFGFVVNPTDGGKYAVEAVLTAPAQSNLFENAAELTRKIALTNIVALAGEATTNLVLAGGVSGFYYSLYDGTAVTNLAADANGKNLNVLCGADAVVTFPEVKKPSEEQGFFSVGVSATPDVTPSDNE